MRKIYLLILITLSIKQNTNAQLFEKRINWNLSSSYFAEVTACEHLSNGNNIIAIHQQANTGQGAAALAEITTSGDTIWTKKFNRAGTAYGENIIDFIREMPDHSFFLAGRTHNSSGFFHAAFWLADANGNITSYKQFTYNTYREITIEDVDIAADGSIYFAGYYSDFYSGGVVTYSWTVALYGKLNPDLSLSWGKTWGDTNHSYNFPNAGTVVGIEIAPDGNLIVVGADAMDPNGLNAGTMQLLKVTPGGVTIWTKQRALVVNSNPTGMDLAPNGEIYVSTQIRSFLQASPHGGYDIQLEKFTSNGNPIWSKSFGTIYNDNINKIKFNPLANNLIMAGYSVQNNNFYMALQASVDTSGALLQSKIHGEPGSNYNYFFDVVPFGNNILMVGTAYTYGGLLIQTDADGNTGCAPNTYPLITADYINNPFTVGIYNGSMQFTFATYSSNYITNPITSTLNCYACSDIFINNNISACQSYFVGGALQVASGIYYDTLAAAGGCDSIIVTNLTIYQNPTVANAGNNQNICNNAASINANTPTIGTGIWSVISGGGNIVNINDPTTGINNLSTGSNILKWTVSNGSCNSSFDEVTIFVGTPSYSSINENSCDSLTINNNTYYTSGTYTQTLQNAAGCDSTISINLTIKNSSSNIISESACNTFTLNNQTYTQTGTYAQTLQNAAGCDSLITLNLVINNADSNIITTSTCNEDYILNNQTYSATGTYTQLLQTSAGCDSTIIIELVVHPAIDTTIIVSGITLASNEINAQYQWWNCSSNSIVNGASSFNYTPSSNGDYAVIINNNGCADTSACYGIYTVGFNNYTSDLNNLEIIPNPNNGFFNIQSNFLTAQFEITNLQGAIVYQGNLSQTDNSIDLQTMPSGMYFLKLFHTNESTTKKILIKK